MSLGLGHMANRFEIGSYEFRWVIRSYGHISLESGHMDIGLGLDCVG